MMARTADQAVRDRLAAAILGFCGRRRLALAASESLTGGLVADAFVRIPGASAVFLGSAVTYAVAAKRSILGVDGALLEGEGAVHPEVAKQMAMGAARLYRAAAGHRPVVGVATTGVAGPGPDDRGNPAGLVYVGVSLPAATGVDVGAGPKVCSEELHLRGARPQIRMASVSRLLTLLARLLGCPTTL